MTTEIKPLVCPMCMDNVPMKYRQYKSAHIYSCPKCPFTGFEWTDQESVEDFAEYINP